MDQQNAKIGCLYRPPWSDETYMEDFGRVVQHVDPHRNGNLWIGGDFNLPKIDWTHQKILPQNPSGTISTALLNLINDFLRTQIVDHPTRQENILNSQYCLLCITSQIRRSSCVRCEGQGKHSQ